MGSMPLALRRRRPVAGRRDERLDLDEQRPAPSMVGATTLPGRRLGVIGEERPRRVGDLERGRRRPSRRRRPRRSTRSGSSSARTQPKRREPLAFEGEHGVDEVLHRLRPGDRAVLRDVADEHDGDTLALRELHEPHASTRGPGRRSRPARRARRSSRSGSSRRRAAQAAPSGRPRRSGRRRARRAPRSRCRRPRRAGRAAPRGGGPGRPTPRRWRR